MRVPQVIAGTSFFRKLLLGTAMVTTLAAGESFAFETEDPFLKKGKSNWKCEAGSCTENNRVRECGLVVCSTEHETCGCDCVSVGGGAYYPKGYCGNKSPYIGKRWEDYRKRDKHGKEAAFGF